MIADVQRELESVVRSVIGWPSTTDAVVVALLPTVQALIADAEKRAAAAAVDGLQQIVDEVEDDESIGIPPHIPLLIKALRGLLDPSAVLDPSGAAEGAGR